ncbi:MAG: hypothetical protein ACOX2F_03415 [bacterium]
MLFSNNKILSAFSEKIYAALLENKYEVLPESFKEINYGFTFKTLPPAAKKEISVAVYHTEKNGFSFVTKDANIRQILNLIISNPELAGSDEAGKGDLFGPLVVCAFVLGKGENEILKLNIKDSKKLKNEEILDIYEYINQKYPDSFSLVKIMPERYNTFYKDLSDKGKNLNHMLGWAHAKAISELLKKRAEISKIVVDKFTENRGINEKIASSASGIAVEFAVRAEQNIAVAAASIMARAHYLISLKYLSKTALLGKFELIPGSGDKSDELLSKIIDEFGIEVVAGICKTHFSNLKSAALPQ